ncbi:hypothetical protein B0J15DRAFT_442693, partial [Fusarium solani]
TPDWGVSEWRGANIKKIHEKGLDVQFIVKQRYPSVSVDSHNILDLSIHRQLVFVFCFIFVAFSSPGTLSSLNVIRRPAIGFYRHRSNYRR